MIVDTQDIVEDVNDNLCIGAKQSHFSSLQVQVRTTCDQDFNVPLGSQQWLC